MYYSQLDFNSPQNVWTISSLRKSTIRTFSVVETSTDSSDEFAYLTPVIELVNPSKHFGVFSFERPVVVSYKWIVPDDVPVMILSNDLDDAIWRM